MLSLTVDPSDVGRVIGKRGVTAQAIRVLLRALGTKQDARYNLKIVNTDEEGNPLREEKSEEKPAEKEDGAQEAEEEVEVTEEEPEEEESSELAEKTRAELADLDDLDI